MNIGQRVIALLLVAVLGCFCFMVLYNVYQGRDLAEKQASPQGQLPDTVKPLAYTLDLRIDPQLSSFSGVVKIDVEIKTAIKEIWLHGEDIDPVKVVLNTAQGSIPLDYAEMGHSGVVHLMAPQTLLPQLAQLEIHYTAPFDSKLGGLYKVEDNQLQYVFSQLQPTGARQVLPSFDEPRFKVPFTIALEVKSHHLGFSNSRLVKEVPLNDGYKRLEFATTQPLPTFLLSFAVGEFDVVEYTPIPKTAVRDQVIPLRGIAVKGKGGQLDYALASTAAMLINIEAYFALPYAYDKLDLLAVPDFAANAMESPGLITYREQMLLFGDAPSFSQQRAFAQTHAHELTHQWFGNLVTIPWWDELWLSEAFAAWMTQKVVSEWNDQFSFERDLIRRGHYIMVEDALVHVRKVREQVLQNDDILSAFDFITYRKGGAVLQMFERYIGAEQFREGVRLHMKRYSHQNADGDQFFASIEAVFDGDKEASLKRAFLSFIDQPGVPDITVNWQCEDQQVKISLAQSRYLPLGTEGNPSQNKIQWDLPVCLTLIRPLVDLSSPVGTEKAISEFANGGHNPAICTMMTEAQQSISVRGACPLAVMPNNEGNGYYRFSFSQADWLSLLSHLDRLSSAEKFVVANNLAAAFRAGDIDASFYLQAIVPFTQQKDWDLVSSPIFELRFIGNYIANDQDQAPLAAYLERLYRPVMNELGLGNDSVNDKADPVATSLLRQSIVSFMAMQVKQPQLREQLLGLAKQYIGYQQDQQLDETVVSPDLAVSTMAVGIDMLGKPYFDALKAQVYKSSDSLFRQRALIALGSTVDPLLAAEVRSMVLSLSIKNNERPYLIQSQLHRAENHRAFFDWLKSYYSLIATVLPEYMVSTLPRIGEGFCEPAMADELAQFFSEKAATISGVKQQLERTIERINICVALKNRHEGGLKFGDTAGWASSH